MKLKKIKPKVEYFIYKMFPKAPEEWDGPYRTLKLALVPYRQYYCNSRGESQDFQIVKRTTATLKVR